MNLPLTTIRPRGSEICMTGAVRTLQKCPKCGGKFGDSPLACPVCLTIPSRYYVHFHWRGESIKVYRGKDGYPLADFDSAYRLLEVMRAQVDNTKKNLENGFDPKEYVAREINALRFSRYYEDWVARRELECKRGHISRSYLKEIKGYGRRYFVPYFQGSNIREIREGNIDDFRNQLPSNLSPKTIRNALGVLKKLFREGYRRRDIIRLPDFPKIPKSEPLTTWITEAEQERVLRHAREPYRSLFLFLMKQGCRPSEARALKWDRVNLKDLTVIIAAGFDLGHWKPYTKEREVRYLPLHPRVAEALAKLPRSITGFVFVNKMGRPLSQRMVVSAWTRAAEKAQVKCTCYEGTRHSLASQAINEGVSERLIGEMLGHRTSASTRRYAKVRAEALKGVWGDKFKQEVENG